MKCTVAGNRLEMEILCKYTIGMLRSRKGSKFFEGTLKTEVQVSSSNNDDHICSLELAVSGPNLNLPPALDLTRMLQC